MQRFNALHDIATSLAVLCIISAFSTQQGLPAFPPHTSHCEALHGELKCLAVNAPLKWVRRSRTSNVYMRTEISVLALLIASPSPWWRVSRQPSGLRPEPSAALSGLLHTCSTAGLECWDQRTAYMPWIAQCGQPSWQCDSSPRTCLIRRKALPSWSRAHQETCPARVLHAAGRCQ